MRLSPPHLLRTLLLSFVLLPATVARAETPPPADFKKDVRPLLETYCFKCHGPEKSKGDVNLSTFGDLAAVQREPKLWQTVLQQVNERARPPAKKPQPTEAERQRLAEWVGHTLNHLDPALIPKDPGRVTI